MMNQNKQVQTIKLNSNLTWDLSGEKSKKKGAGRKMWTIALIALSALTVYAKLALMQHNKRVLNGEEE